MFPVATGLWQPGIPVLEKVVRSIVVYGFLVGILRLAGKRTLGQFTSFDLVVLLLLANTVQSAIVGNDVSLTGGLIGAAVLVGLNYMVVRAVYNNREAEHALEGGVTILMKNGRFVDENMKRQFITRGELEAAARRQGIQHMSDIRVARLELGGAVTFELSEPTSRERHITDVIARLDRIERMLERSSHADPDTSRTGGPQPGGMTVAHEPCTTAPGDEQKMSMSRAEEALRGGASDTDARTGS